MVNLTVITGPPCAGKSTYATQQALPGDIIIDFDAIARALGSPVGHGHDSHITQTASAAWSAAIREALKRLGRHSTWIIDSKPSTWRTGEYDRAGARYVRLHAGTAELHRRADEAGRPAAWHARIDQFTAGTDPQPRTVTRW